MFDQLNSAANLTYTGLWSQTQSLDLSVIAELAKDSLDASAIGNLYADIEALNRKENGVYYDLATQLQAQLTVAQAAKLKPLVDADSVKLVITEAACVNLMDFPARLILYSGPPSYSVAVGAQGPGTSYGCGFFR